MVHSSNTPDNIRQRDGCYHDDDGPILSNLFAGSQRKYEQIAGY